VQLQDYTLQVQELVHDLAGVDYSPTELTAYVNAGRTRTALDLHCVRRLIQNATIIPGQEQYPLFGAVVGGAIVGGGSGYTSVSPPTVTIGPPPAGGTQATAVAVVDPAGSGAITQIVMTNWGGGYVAVPTMTIAAPGVGVTATATALATINVFDWNSISLLNGNLRYTLSWLPFTPFQAFCRAYTTQLRPSAVWSEIQEANIVFLFPIPDQVYPVDIDCLLIPTDLVSATDVDTQVIPPSADCVQWYAAHKALLKLQNFAQAEVMQKKYDQRVRDMIVQRQDRRIISVYRNWFRRMQRL
jgi:hypothetical protein